MQRLAVVVLFAFASVSQAALQSKVVEYKQGDTVCEGYIAWDDSTDSKRPGVIVVHEWMGHNPYVRMRADRLAQLGYVGFAIDIYGKGVRATTAEEAGKLSRKYKQDRPLLRARAKAALDFLRQQPQVDGDRIAAIGYCFGGTTVLEMARGGMDLKGVASFHGDLGTPHPEDARNIKCKVLALHGADDPFVPEKTVKAFEEEMRNAKVDWQLIAYGNTVHSFTYPEAGQYKVAGAAYNAESDRRSWQAMQDFFNEIFKRATPTSVTLPN
jgi:dienelactone hydrolase